jgi:hypothetical protein
VGMADEAKDVRWAQGNCADTRKGRARCRLRSTRHARANVPPGLTLMLKAGLLEIRYEPTHLVMLSATC